MSREPGYGSLPYDALLFDLGGVVIEIDFDRVFARWARHAGCDVAAIKGRFAFDAFNQRHERDEIDAAAYFASLRRSLGVDISDAQFLDGWNEVFVGEVPGMADLLRQAQARLPLYLFSNSNRVHHLVWAQRYAEVLGLFRRVFVSSDLGLRKPEREAFRTVAAAIGIPPQRILFFDDSRENVEGAIAAGMPAIHVRSAADVREGLRPVLAAPV